MKQAMRVFLGSLLICSTLIGLSAADPPEPVTPEAMPETRALLQLLCDLSGKYTLTGQHNYPNTKSANSRFASRYIGKTPVIFGSDMGFAKAGDTDSYLARPEIVQEAIHQHQLGSIVALCWHAVPPTFDEPTTFMPLPNSDPKRLASVQGKLLDDQFRDLLTPGTALYKHWCSQVDAIAVFLKQLEDAHVPVLWRPYHEMNGDWFWWGGRTGEYSTAALYRQMFDRLVNHHHLRNLVWVWSVDRPSRPGMEHERYFPGLEYMDVLALDVYGSDFKQSYYDSLVSLSQGKPLALAEVGSPPTPEILAQQPRWTYYMTWAGMVRNTSRKQYAALMADPRVLNLEDAAYERVTEPYRKACGLAPLHFVPAPADFTGTWILDDSRSELGRMGARSASPRLEVVQTPDALGVKTTRVLEYADDQVSEERYTLDGAESKSEFMNSPRVTTAHLSPDRSILVLDSVVSLNRGGVPSSLKIKDRWSLIDGGDSLLIKRSIRTPQGDQELTLVYYRR